MIENREGQRVPAVTFQTRGDHAWVDRRSEEIFAGKTVVVFSLPGAFTPTCSSSHVPRYNQLASSFGDHGVDEIVCISVNDAFVMNEWKESQKAENITFIPDGNGEFTAGMGMLVGKEDLGFGKRSWRYSMLVRDGVIEKMFVEQEVPGDPYDVSDADTMLRYIAPDAPKPMDVTIFSRVLSLQPPAFHRCSSTANKSAARKHLKRGSLTPTGRFALPLSKDLHAAPPQAE